MADLNFNCPQCGQNLTTDESLIGSEIECPSCSKPIEIPSVDSENHFLVYDLEEDLKSTEESTNNNYCSNCGNKLNGGVKFCSSCGSVIGETLATSPPVSGATHSQTYKKQHTLTGGWWGLILVMNTVFCANKLLKEEVSSFAFIYAVCGLVSLIGAIRAFILSSKD